MDTIGKVKLNLSRYPGEDKYCDGEIEDVLLDIAKDRAEVEYPRIIEEMHSWPILYHLSSLRENIVEWLPITKNMKVLEVGSGCGAITGALARKAGQVTCCDLSLKRSRINAYRHMDCDNVTIHVGNFTDVEADLDRDYDYICLIGVFEYAQAYVDSADPYGDFLKLLKSHCKPNGNIAIAIENKFGLKYWAGCMEDHLGRYFASLEDYPDGGVVRTFTDRGLIEIAKRCGFREYRMYYPYPDYKFMTSLFSDNRLPSRGELKDNIRNMDRERYVLFNEKEVFDTILDEDLFHLYSNSYMLILGTSPQTDYARYSNDRMDEYSICTEISTVRGRKIVKKRALSDAAKEHLAHYAESYRKLAARYVGSGLTINHAVLSEDGSEIMLDYADGISLENMLDKCLAENDMDGFETLFREYLERISYGEEKALITDLDLIFSNIIIKDDRWTVIDYEWTTEKAVPAKEVAFRAIYCYVLEDEKRDKLSLDLITDILGINETMAAELREQEMAFQKSVTGNHKSLGEIREAIGNEIYRLEDSVRADRHAGDLRLKTQIYENKGAGFSEEQSYFVDELPAVLKVSSDVKSLRIDPCSEFCIVSINRLTWNGETFRAGGLGFKSNGKKVGKDLYVFATSDPGFTLSLKGLDKKGINELEVDMTVTVIDAETASRF